MHDYITALKGQMKKRIICSDRPDELHVVRRRGWPNKNINNLICSDE